ncbi:MAG: hypothetical protein JO233_07490, partial [Candidatus Eremiobacteraeota bacterium]|nr:hypothetical protein [Candidatus Eremiobacteraeota bacterium]
RGHSTAAEAATMAREAGARRLVLTHYGDESTSRDLDQAAREVFSGETEPGVRGHSSAADAAAMARDAHVRRLILTHYGEESTSRDLDEAARETFEGPILVADDHRTIELEA